MLLANGCVRVVISEGNGFDEQGHPVQQAETLGTPIPCNYSRNNYLPDNTVAGSETEYAKYTILIEPQEFPPCNYRLYDAFGNDLGKFQAKIGGITYLQAVGCIQISM